MRRNPKWGQENPTDQLRVILGSIEMDLKNVSDGISRDTEATLARAKKHVQECQELATAISKGDIAWDKP